MDSCPVVKKKSLVFARFLKFFFNYARLPYKKIYFYLMCLYIIIKYNYFIIIYKNISLLFLNNNDNLGKSFEEKQP